MFFVLVVPGASRDNSWRLVRRCSKGRKEKKRKEKKRKEKKRRKGKRGEREGETYKATRQGSGRSVDT